MSANEKNEENDCISSIALVYIELDKRHMYGVNGSWNHLEVENS